MPRGIIPIEPTGVEYWSARRRQGDHDGPSGAIPETGNFWMWGGVGWCGNFTLARGGQTSLGR